MAEFLKKPYHYTVFIGVLLLKEKLFFRILILNIEKSSKKYYHIYPIDILFLFINIPFLYFCLNKLFITIEEFELLKFLI